MSPFGKKHVAGWNPALVAVADKKGAIRIDDEVGWPTPERGDSRDDAAVAAFNLDEGSHWSLVDRDDHLIERELFAIFLVAKPDPVSESKENRDKAFSVFDARLELLAEFERRMFGGALEGHIVVPVLDPDAQNLATRAERSLLGIEQEVRLQPPRSQRPRASGHYGRAGGFRRLKPQFDLALEGRGGRHLH